VAKGKTRLHSVPIGKNHPVDTVRLNLAGMAAPDKLTLTVWAKDGSARNHWDFWVYPGTPLTDNAQTTGGDDICICDSLDEKAERQLASGGTVLLAAAGKVRLGSDIKQTYLPVFWNTLWLSMRPPHTTGAYIDTQHPLFGFGFPTDSWANLNWWELLNRAQVMDLRELPADYQPPIQPICTWHISSKLGMLIEARVGRGRLLMTTMDITDHLDRRPVARQMRHAILSYMQSPQFQPSLQLGIETIRHFFDGIPEVKLNKN
jgi:hypothetical protein